MIGKSSREQAEYLVEQCAELQKEILVRHVKSILEEMKLQIHSKNVEINRLKDKIDLLERELNQIKSK